MGARAEPGVRALGGGGALRPVVFGLCGVLSVAASLYGYLDAANHPTLRLAGAIFLSIGAAALLLIAHAETLTHVALEGRLHQESGVVVRFSLALISLQAGVIHFAVIQQHLDEYWLYGVFFLVLAIFQVVTALWMVAHPSPLAYVAVLLVNLFTVGLWLLTRTVGALVGPAATEQARAGFGDIASTAFEIVLALGCVALLRARWVNREVSWSSAEVSLMVAVMIITGVTILAVFSAVAGPPFVSHVG